MTFEEWYIQHRHDPAHLEHEVKTFWQVAWDARQPEIDALKREIEQLRPDSAPLDTGDDSLCNVRRLRAQIRELEAWKESAMTVLGEWDEVWEAAGRPGRLGASKAVSLREYLRTRNDMKNDTNNATGSEEI
ncbi:MAG: hypothetical protein O2931_08380 [Planctomycetota bacterium]|nr:hypothetical protein [Planctomycetota bacterium]